MTTDDFSKPSPDADAGLEAWSNERLALAWDQGYVAGMENATGADNRNPYRHQPTVQDHPNGSMGA